MNNLQLITYKQAIVLKELGYPQKAITSIGWYTPNGQLQNSSINTTISLLEGECVAHSLELVVKWLREEKDIHVCPIYYSTKIDNSEWYSCEVNQHQINNDAEYATYEDALLAGINEAIKILKNETLHNMESKL